MFLYVKSSLDVTELILWNSEVTMAGRQEEISTDDFNSLIDAIYEKRVHESGDVASQEISNGIHYGW